MSCFDVCKQCEGLIESSESAHQWHDPENCNRFVTGVCACDGWVCLDCCPEPECSPLQEACLIAKADVVARAEAWEAAQHAPSSTVHAENLPTGFYFGAVG